MVPSTRRERGSVGHGWLSTILGVLVLVAGGFALGLFFGVVFEEPELVAGHVAGRSSEIDWSAERVVAAGGDVGSAPEPSAAVDPAAPAETAPVAAPPIDRPRTVAEARPAPRALPPVGAPAPKRVEPKTPAAAGARFVIQVGAFGTSKAADGVAGRLRAAGYPVQVIAPQSDDRWRVRVGPLPTREEADATARRLKAEERLPTWVLREQAP